MEPVEDRGSEPRRLKSRAVYRLTKKGRETRMILNAFGGAEPALTKTDLLQCGAVTQHSAAKTISALLSDSLIEEVNPNATRIRAPDRWEKR